MRLALLGLLAAGLFSAEVAVAEPCTSPVDQGAFDVAALKSELMLVALTCDMRPQYNAFIEKFRPDLVKEERALNGWFSRAYGRRATQQHDDYITNLANVESHVGLQRGNLFCKEYSPMFNTVAGLRNIGELVAYAQRIDLPQPLTLVSCVRQPAPQRKVMRTAQEK
jgi:hypothetical protein